MPTTKEELTLKVGRSYRGKKPKGCGFPPLFDDRSILFIGGGKVQYDSPSVKIGRNYPTVTVEKFLAWAARDVTDELPRGGWAYFEFKHR